VKSHLSRDHNLLHYFFCFFAVLPIYLTIVSCFKAKHWVLFFLGFNQILEVFLTKDEFQSHRYINNVKENMNTELIRRASYLM
jgi:GTP cyclohydrolase III